MVTHLEAGGIPVDVVDLKNDAGTRLLGAIMPHADDTWVFKLSGPIEAVSSQKSSFDEFIRSIRFDQAPPAPAAPVLGPAVPGGSQPGIFRATGIDGAQWALPTGWTAEAGNGFLLASIHPAGNSLAQIKVSNFRGVGGGAGANVSRWRGAVGLDPVDDAHADAGQNVTLGGRPWTIHDYTGPANGGSRLIVASTDAAGIMWFFRLEGPTDAIGKIKADFDQFLASIRIGS